MENSMATESSEVSPLSTPPAQSGGEVSSTNAEESSSNVLRGTTLDAEQVAGFLGTDKATLERFQKFVDANGQFDKAFDKMRQTISNPEKPAQPAAQPAQQPAQQSEQSASAQPQYQQPPKGYASLQELSVERYFKDLAADPKYANISEQIVNGDVLKEMTALGMNPIDENYNINVGQVNKFLELKSASVPTKPTSVEPTNIPTVEYINEGKEITDRNQAFDVLRQSFELKQKGLPPHPDEQKAQEFLKKM